MDENDVLAAARYVDRNPVRAGIVEEAWENPWSSALAHLEGRDDLLVKVTSLLQTGGDGKDSYLMRIRRRRSKRFGGMSAREGLLGRIVL
ncbi:MAG: hypothetical protein OEW45_18850 [Deltaproteobacteria bacterium]|nr:hypothetical protein [Deltaproteobacteria bacterium]